jgi:PAS domain-containing protein
MATDPFARSLTDVLINQAPEFLGLYDATLGWFTRVNPTGAQLLGYESEQAFLAEPSRALPTPTFSAEDWAARPISS